MHFDVYRALTTAHGPGISSVFFLGCLMRFLVFLSHRKLNFHPFPIFLEGPFSTPAHTFFSDKENLLFFKTGRWMTNLGGLLLP